MFTDSAGNEDFAPYLSALSGGFGAGAYLRSGNTTASLLRANAAIAGLQAQGELRKGAEETQLYQTHLDQKLGQQGAAIGGSGLSMSGSPLRALAQTAQFGAQDIQRTQLNAARAAWGFQTSQQGDYVRAGLASQSGMNNAFGTLISSGARAYGQWNSPWGS